MRSFLVFPDVPKTPLPPGFDGLDVRFPPQLVETLLAEFTKPGDVVFDPFTGFGTTLIVAERMGRVACGVEWDSARFKYVRNQLADPSFLFCGDSRNIDGFRLPALDFSLTSPPYMAQHDGENPLTNYGVPFAPGENSYACYLRELSSVYAQLRTRLRPGARAVVEVSNLHPGFDPTTLAWDVARAVGQVLPFEREIVCCWEGGYGFGYDHSYCLVFRNPEQESV